MGAETPDMAGYRIAANIAAHRTLAWGPAVIHLAIGGVGSIALAQG